MKDIIRFATSADAERILEIYAPYITDTVISFEYDVPTPVEFSARVEEIRSRYPYLVYERLTAGRTSANACMPPCLIF